MEALRVLLLWGFVLGGISLGVTLLFCLALSGVFQPGACDTLLNLVASVFPK